MRASRASIIVRRLRRLLLTTGALLLPFVLGAGSAAAAGSLWTQSTPGSGEYYLGLDFIDANNGWLVGDEQVVMRTYNGGATWVEQHRNADNYALSKIQMWSTTRGWAVGNGGAHAGSGAAILATTDGINWAPQAEPPYIGVLEDLCFVSSTEGWAVGSGSDIIHTSNGGATWTMANGGVPTGVDDIWFNGVDFADSSNGWAVGEDYYVQPASSYWASIYRTSNGGSTWTSALPARTFIAGSFHGVDFIAPSGLWACGEDTTLPYGQRGMIWHSNDSGLTWARQTVPANTDTLNAIHFVTADLGWAVGDDVILVTTNGGGLWTKESNPDAYNGILNDVDSVDGVTAWAAGFGDRLMTRGHDGTPPATTNDAPAGWRNRPVTVHLNASDTGSGVAKTEYRIDGGSLKAGSSVYFPASVVTHAGDGDHQLTYWSTDRAGNVETQKTCRVRIDTRPPVGASPYTYSARRNAYVSLRYRVTDVVPQVYGGAPAPRSAVVTLRIRNAAGATLMTVPVGTRTIGTWYTYRWRATVRPATYTYSVRGTDPAGNVGAWSTGGRIAVRP